MTENPSTEPDLGDELRALGKSLSDLLHAMWASEERKKVQKDIETGMNELGSTISKAASDFSESKTGQQMKADLQDLKQRFETGQVQDKARQELLAALKRANAELTRAANRWGPASTDAPSAADQPETPPDAGGAAGN